ncbi:discoidin domain-containing protein [Umezawaea tangerina]|uniref:Pectate lyase-like protein n=1 Tax=Umezawaea tangerina TaxID=84725 RepID=A0A2T0SMC7_9PSEU|nr:discoidin domain-containing protein [Umezawaea tangerina]PRY34558.1 pectate lyase-like protein [Umezawaea tangerina]
MRTESPLRRPLALSAAALSAAVVTALVVVASPESASGQVAAAAAYTSPFDIAGRGATVPFTEQEAESAATNGTKIGPGRRQSTLEGEASGRQAVTLSGQGKYVEFTLTKPANSIDIRYSVPDGNGGAGITAPLSLYLEGAKASSLTLTSKYSWRYGSYPYANDPGQGKPHHMYDSTRALFGRTLAAGAKVRLQVDSGDNAPSYTIDLADFELVAQPATRPANSVSVTEHGAVAGDSGDDSDAFVAAVAAAKAAGKEVWIPAGTFTVTRHITVDQVTVRGAGHWHSVVRGNRVGFYGLGEPSSCGVGGNSGRSGKVELRDFAIIGEVTTREDCDQVNAIGGALGGGSVVSGMLLQHTKVGLWLDGPFDGLTVSGNKVVDQLADGMNLHQGISGVLIENNLFRNISDDGIALWSEHDADHHNTIRHNTVVVPMKANGIAIYGGHDNTATDNVVADTQDQGGGIHVGNRFQSVPLAGTTTLSRNTTLRAGVLDSNWQFGVGALWFDARDGAMSGRIDVTDTDLVDSNYEAIQFINGTITNVFFSGVRIIGAGTFALQLQSPGAASFTNVTATGLGNAGTYNCMGGTSFAITRGTGNTGWDNTYCGSWPDPVHTDPTTPPTTTTTTTTTTTPPPDPTGNAARGKPTTATSQTGGFPTSNTTDGNQSSYWESTNGSFPQSLTVDLGSPLQISRVTLKLPPATAWTTRAQTLTIQSSTNGSTYQTLAPSTDYRFDPTTGNTATTTFTPTQARYVRLTITANTGWPAAQISEFEVYNS